MDRARKEAEVEYLIGCMTKAQIAMCADYRGLTVSEITDLRAQLRDGGSFGRVVKNTLARVSVDQAFSEQDSGDVAKFKELLEGPSFLVFSENDPVSAAKVMTKFAKEHEQLEVKGGWFEGKFVGLDELKALSSLPSKEELQSKLLSVLNAPATQVVQLLQAPGRQLVQLLAAYRDKLEKGE